MYRITNDYWCCRNEHRKTPVLPLGVGNSHTGGYLLPRFTIIAGKWCLVGIMHWPTLWAGGAYGRNFYGTNELVKLAYRRLQFRQPHARMSLDLRDLVPVLPGC